MDQVPPPPPQPAGPKPNYGCGCLLVALVVIIMATFFGSGGGSGTPGVPEKHKITTAVWMQKAAAVGGQNYRMTGVMIVSAKALYQAVGEPSSSQSIGGDACLYWDCEDGQIQMVTPDGFLRTQGMLAGKINSY